MANVQPLPARNERKAPKWDSQYEEQLPMFFEEFETVAKEAAIDSDDLKMKKEALRYVDAKTMRFWRSLDTFEDDQKTWDEFKKEVLSNYPGAEQVPETTTDTLKKVVTKFAKSGVSNSQELAEYHREFATVSKSLTKHGILSGVQVAGYYVQVFPDSVRAQLNMRLQVQHTAKKKGEAYSLAELKGAVDFLLSDANTIYVGRESTSIRGVTAIVGERPVHCITDWGCSIIAMSMATCNALGVMFDPTRCIPLQSANGKTDWTLGIARDVPFRFSEVTAILQVHIVDSPAYDVLLGRPFEVLTQARTQSFLSGDQHITITDPNTKKIVTIPTVPREPPKF
ncbi:hypothetical protein BT96DRAFT_827501 [Gymnopus androsaceus JB14]|uniref:Uncharacterized protein n=1 Tax=Gymnopus androsaceus JB14 TaxID=1447944 RepID=A0A6A4HAB1_9AGAR|nr:hypothetical protein BT96DRAFT_827501 [Gymnopus androsaceus JB14]